MLNLVFTGSPPLVVLRLERTRRGLLLFRKVRGNAKHSTPHDSRMTCSRPMRTQSPLTPAQGPVPEMLSSIQPKTRYTRGRTRVFLATTPMKRYCDPPPASHASMPLRRKAFEVGAMGSGFPSGSDGRETRHH
jgi:hypothetical protein